MKTFEDLVFEQHHVGNGLHALMFFENGYGISVVRFELYGRYGSYTDNDNEWECAVVRGNNNSFDLCYDSGITDDVIGHLSNDDVTELMTRIQKLPSP